MGNIKAEIAQGYAGVWIDPPPQGLPWTELTLDNPSNGDLWWRRVEDRIEWAGFLNSLTSGSNVIFTTTIPAAALSIGYPNSIVHYVTVNNIFELVRLEIEAGTLTGFNALAGNYLGVQVYFTYPKYFPDSPQSAM